VVLQSPVYPPFFNSIENNGRRVVDNTLRYSERGYEMDLELLESQIDGNTKMLALCSPHNPVGRVWSRKELEGVAEIVLKHDLLVFSDEIHGDLIYSEAEHIPFASLSPEIAERTITGIAPSKTFNIAGLKASVIITANESLRRKFDTAQERTFGLYNANTFAICAAEAAYREGEEWLEALLEYLEENRDYALDRLDRELPEIKVAKPEGTFLLWLDCNAFGLSPGELYETVSCEGRVGLNDGRSFGPGGEGFLRLNIGCPRSVLAEGLDRLTGVLGPLQRDTVARS
jgi:cystathionine beta-lyase